MLNLLKNSVLYYIILLSIGSHAMNEKLNNQYSVIDGERKDFSEGKLMVNRRYDGRVQLFENNVMICDLLIKEGKETGFKTIDEGNNKFSTVNYKDGERDGLSRVFENGKIVSEETYRHDQLVEEKAYDAKNNLVGYGIFYGPGFGWAEFKKNDGKYHSLTCLPVAKDNPFLREICGFAGEKSTDIFDGTGKINRKETYKDGILVAEAGGDSKYSSLVEVKYKNGKKDGLEKIFREKGILAETNNWIEGKLNGTSVGYFDDGKTISYKKNWKNGELVDVTEYFMNGKQSIFEKYLSPSKKNSEYFYDDGKLFWKSEQVLIEVNYFGYKMTDWMKNGLYQYWSNWNSKHRLAEESNYKNGNRDGISKYYDKSGKVIAEYQYNNKLLESEKLFSDGKLISTKMFNKDGSIK